jgi:CrcB protein
MIFNFLLVGLGGALGAMLRHGVGLMAVRWGAVEFPWATVSINVFGSFCIGILCGGLAVMSQWSQEVRLFAVVGVLGGFTTFSAFSLDTILLLERGQIVQAALYVAGSVVASLVATFIGLVLIRMMVG